jgi:hypothetical protein
VNAHHAGPGQRGAHAHLSEAYHQPDRPRVPVPAPTEPVIIAGPRFVISDGPHGTSRVAPREGCLLPARLMRSRCNSTPSNIDKNNLAAHQPGS